GQAGDHPELLLHGRVRGRRFHPAVCEGWSLVLVEIGQDRGGFDASGWEAQWCLRAHSARCFGSRGAVCGDEYTGNSVIRTCAVDIVLHDLDAGYLPRRDRRVQLLDRRLFETKWLCAGLRCHAVAPLMSAHDDVRGRRPPEVVPRGALGRYP